MHGPRYAMSVHDTCGAKIKNGKDKEMFKTRCCKGQYISPGTVFLDGVPETT